MAQTAQAQKVAISNNLLYDAWLTPNLRVGVKLSPHWSAGVTAVMVGNPTVNINVGVGGQTNHDAAEIPEGTKLSETYPIPSHKKGKIGAINNVYGGGNAAKVIGDATVNIGVTDEETLTTVTDDPATAVNESKLTVVGADIRGNVYGGGNNAEVTGNTNVTIGKKNE